jgi:hypothetical protein
MVLCEHQGTKQGDIPKCAEWYCEHQGTKLGDIPKCAEWYCEHQGTKQGDISVQNGTVSTKGLNEETYQIQVS